MPLQTRVCADGEIVAHPARGLFYGNRGGQFHDVTSKTQHPTKRWATKQWICCTLVFKDRKRPVMSAGYTPLFFLDEVTALSAGHRPCFECRRKAAVEFAERWQSVENLPSRPKVAHMDSILHEQRLDGKAKRSSSAIWQDLPAGAVVETDEGFVAKKDGKALIWKNDGYLPGSALADNAEVSCLTPPIILDIFRAGYTPQWHPSSE